MADRRRSAGCAADRVCDPKKTPGDEAFARYGNGRARKFAGGCRTREISLSALELPAGTSPHRRKSFQGNSGGLSERLRRRKAKSCAVAGNGGGFRFVRGHDPFVLRLDDFERAIGSRRPDPLLLRAFPLLQARERMREALAADASGEKRSEFYS